MTKTSSETTSIRVSKLAKDNESSQTNTHQMYEPKPDTPPPSPNVLPHEINLSALLGIAPRSYAAIPLQKISREYIYCIHEEHRLAFSPPPSLLHHHSAQIRMQQLNTFDLAGARILVLSNINDNFLDVIHQTKAKRIIQISARSLLGPIQITNSNNKLKKFKNASIDDLPFFTDGIDHLWIPDPYLASLVFRSADLTRQLSRNIKKSLIFSLIINPDSEKNMQSNSWTDRKIRTHLHANAFLEINNTNDSGGDELITHYHETKALHFIKGNPNNTVRQTIARLYCAQKLPSPYNKTRE